jgi:hypothetical protein
MHPTTDPMPLDYATRRAERSRKFWAGAAAFAVLFFFVAAGAIVWVRSQAARRAQLSAQVALQRQQQAKVAAALATALQNSKQIQAQVQQLAPAAPATPAPAQPANAVLRLPRVLARWTDAGLELRLRNDHAAGDVLLDPADRIEVRYGDRHQFAQFLSPQDLMPPDLSALAPGESGKPITVRVPDDAVKVKVLYQHTDSATGQRVETAIDVESP